eukprot:501180_1
MIYLSHNIEQKKTIKKLSLMGIFNIILDTWAIGEPLNIATMTIQSICLFISLILIFIAIHSIHKDHKYFKSNCKLQLLQYIQLLMMIFSCVFIFFHFWNYIHLHISTNSMDCQFWFVSLMTAFTITRILVFAFLMLRSSFLFENTFCELPSNISITLLIVVILSNIIPLILQIIDNEPITPFPDKGFCWRIQGKIGDYGGYISQASNSVASFAAVIIFYWKAHSVKTFVNSVNGLENELLQLHTSFKRHIILGIYTVSGTIIVSIAGQFLSVTLGISFALDQTVNNILTLIMLKEHAMIYKQSSKCQQEIHTNSSSKTGNTVGTSSTTFGTDIAFSHLKLNRVEVTEYDAHPSESIVRIPITSQIDE